MSQAVPQAFALLMFLGSLFGGGNDLLDYLPADAFWKAKSIPATVQRMEDEAQPIKPDAPANLIKALREAGGEDRDRLTQALTDLGSAARPDLERLSKSGDPDLEQRARLCLSAISERPRSREIRQLMAIRTLGLLRDQKSLPLLQSLQKRPEPFVAEYAGQAIAEIEGKPALTRSGANIKDDLWRLPSGCRIVGQIVPPLTAPALPDVILHELELKEGKDKQLAIDTLAVKLLQIAEQVGNIRFDGITFGASEDPTDKNGFAVALLRCKYDHAAVNAILARSRLPFNDTTAGRVYLPGSQAILAVSDDLLIVADSQGDSPARYVERCFDARGRDKIRDSAEMTKAIDAIDRGQPIWTVARSSGRGPGIAGMEALNLATLVGSMPQTGELKIHAQTEFPTPEATIKASGALQLSPDKPSSTTQRTDAFFEAGLRMSLRITDLQLDGQRLTGDVSFSMSRLELMQNLLGAAAGLEK